MRAAEVLEGRGSEQYVWGHLAGTESPASVLDMATGELLDLDMARAPFIYKWSWPRDTYAGSLSANFALQMCLLFQ